MKKQTIIRPVFGWVLLVLFTFSITPRQLLHDGLADHTDLSDSFTHSGTAFIKKGFSCERLNLVAESPFTANDKAANEIIARSFREYILFPDHSFTPEAFSLSSLRGPPCI